jgi:hypothetical protein
MKIFHAAVAAAALCALCACDEERIIDNFDSDDDDGNSGLLLGEGHIATPSCVFDIADWDGTTATDAAADIPGTDTDIYHEANAWTTTVTVNFDGEQAQVSSTSAAVKVRADGAYVTVDMLSGKATEVEINVSGATDNGALKIYGEKKFKLNLNGVHIASQKGAAINNQCKKRVFLNLASGTVNSLSDAATYTTEPYYLASQDEDRKGCFFSEGNVVVSGQGVLSVAGHNRHGLATDGCLVVRPGATIVVTETAKNAIHVKGDSKDGIGVQLLGGYLHLTTAAAAGKGIKTDLGVTMTGGRVVVRTSGDAIYDETDADTSAAAAISTTTGMTISGGSLQLADSGIGSKGLNVSGDLRISGGSVDVWTTGGRYTYSAELTSVAKAIKCDGSITITGGTVNAASIGGESGCDALDAKKSVTISGGTVNLYASEDAMSATTAINISGGEIFAYAAGRAGISTRGTITIAGGTIRAFGGGAPGIAFDKTALLKISGGDVIALGVGDAATAANCLFTQSAAQWTGLHVVENAIIAVEGTSLTATAPVAYEDATLLVSSPQFTAGAEYVLNLAGTLAGKFTAQSGELVNVE